MSVTTNPSPIESLVLGRPGKTLLIASASCESASLTVAATATLAAGTYLTLSSSVCPGDASFSAGSISNAALIDVATGFGGARSISGGIANTGTIDLNAGTMFGGCGAGVGAAYSNSGTISVPGGLEIDSCSGGTFIDTGVIAPGNGGPPTYVGGTFTLEAAGSVPLLTLRDANFVNDSLNPAKFYMEGRGQLSGGVAEGQFLQILGTCAEPALVTAARGLVSSGSIALQSSGCPSDAEFDAPGFVNRNSFGSYADAGGTRTFKGSMTLEGAGGFGVGSGTLWFRGRLTNYDPATGTLNSGSLGVVGTLVMTAPSFQSEGIATLGGTIWLQGGSIVDASGASGLRNLASVTKDGILLLYENSLSTGPLTNDGVIQIAPPNVLTVNGRYTQLVDGTLYSYVVPSSSGNEEGQLSVTGKAFLGGTLTVQKPSPIPPTGSAFTVLLAGLVEGRFDKITKSGGGRQGLYFVVRYDRTDVTVVVNHVYIQASPSSGAAGSSFTLTGNGFAAGETVDLSLGPKVFAPATADGDGAFSVTETVPSLPPQAFTITATGETSFVSVTTMFTVDP